MITNTVCIKPVRGNCEVWIGRIGGAVGLLDGSDVDGSVGVSEDVSVTVRAVAPESGPPASGVLLMLSSTL